MDIEVKIDVAYAQPKLVIHTAELTPELAELIKKLSSGSRQIVTGYKEEAIFILQVEEIYSFFTEAQGVFAKTREGIFKVKSRLYELEESHFNHDFIRISQSEIINFAYVESLDMELNGTIRIKLKNGDYHFVSRRFVSKIKAYLKM